MAYTALDLSKPDAATQNGTQFAQAIRDNLKALRDADFLGGESGWTYSQSGGTASEPAIMLWSKGTERIRISCTWGTTGGENGQLTSATLEYSSDSGSNYDTIETRAATYDSSGNFTGGKHTLALSKLQALPGIVKQQLAAINALTVNAGTGLSGGGAISGSPTLSFSTAWGDARYATLSGATFTGNIVVKTSSHTVVTPGALAVDWTASDRQAKSVSANSTFTFTAPAGPANLMLKVANTSASARTMTWPAAVKWPNTPPAQAANTTTIYLFWWDGTSYWGSYIPGYAN